MVQSVSQCSQCRTQTLFPKITKTHDKKVSGEINQALSKEHANLAYKCSESDLRTRLLENFADTLLGRFAMKFQSKIGFLFSVINVTGSEIHYQYNSGFE